MRIYDALRRSPYPLHRAAARATMALVFVAIGLPLCLLVLRMLLPRERSLSLGAQFGGPIALVLALLSSLYLVVAVHSYFHPITAGSSDTNILADRDDSHNRLRLPTRLLVAGLVGLSASAWLWFYSPLG